MRSWSQPTESTCQLDHSCEVQAIMGGFLGAWSESGLGSVVKARRVLAIFQRQSFFKSRLGMALELGRLRA